MNYSKQREVVLDALINNVNSLSPGIYVISYTAEFNNQRVNKKKTINIK